MNNKEQPMTDCKLCTKCGNHPVRKGHRSWCKPCLNQNTKDYHARQKAPAWRDDPLNASLRAWLLPFIPSEVDPCSTKIQHMPQRG